MGNHPAHFKRLSEDTLPPMKVGFDDSHSMSIEMEPLQPENGNNKWHKTCTQLSTHSKRWACRKFKPRLVIAACFLIIPLASVVTLTALSVFMFTRTSDDSLFASKQDVFELQLLMNESLDNIIQLLNGQSKLGPTGCNDTHTLQLQDQVNSFHVQLKSMQSTEVDLIGQIDAIQQNLSGLSELAHTLQNHVDTLPRRDSLLELDVDNAHRNVTKLTKKIYRLEGIAANLSSAQLDLESGMKLFNSNVSDLVTHVQSDVSSISDSQSHVSETIASLQLNISQLDSQLNAIHSSIQHALLTSQSDASISNRLSQLESQLNTLNSQIHNPVNLYKNCKEDTISCSIDSSRTSDYWRECRTEYLPLHKEGWYTMSHQCIYKSASRKYMEVLTTFEMDGQLRCDCDVTYPGNDSERHRPVSHDISATCTLVITRCPLSQTVYE